MTQESAIELPVGSEYENADDGKPAPTTSPDAPDSPFDGNDEGDKPYGVISPMIFEDTANQRPNCEGGRVITHHRPVAGDPTQHFPPWVGTVVVKHEDKSAQLVAKSSPIQFVINSPAPGDTPESFAECLGLAFQAYDEAAAVVIAENVEQIKQQIKQQAGQGIQIAGGMPSPLMQPGDNNRQKRRRARSGRAGGVI